MDKFLTRLEGVGKGLVASTGVTLRERRQNAALGCRTSEVALELLAQVAWIEKPDLPDDAPEELIEALDLKATALLAELEPKTATEAMLATQMIGAQRLAMRFLGRANTNGARSELIDVNVNRAIRLMRVFNEQLEAMAKLKGKAGQQRVVVEHVTVQEGGQAIVGAVTAAKGLPGGSDRG